MQRRNKMEMYTTYKIFPYNGYQYKYEAIYDTGYSPKRFIKNYYAKKEIGTEEFIEISVDEFREAEALMLTEKD